MKESLIARRLSVGPLSTTLDTLKQSEIQPSPQEFTAYWRKAHRTLKAVSRIKNVNTGNKNPWHFSEFMLDYRFNYTLQFIIK